MRLCLYQPEIPQNTGTLLRLAACMQVGIDIIEPCGFVFSDRKLRRSGMDYVDHVEKEIHGSWESYYKKPHSGRLVLLDTKGSTSHTDFAFDPMDTLLLGRESDGVPESVYAQTDAQIFIPMHPPLRSLNVAVAGAMVLNEALRQTHSFYKEIS